METDFAEWCLHKTRLDGGYFHIAGHDIDAKAIAEGFDSGLCRAIDCRTGIGIKTGRGAEVYDVTFIFFHHCRKEGAGDEEEALDICIDHFHRIFRSCVLIGLEASGKTCVIHEHIRRTEGIEYFGGDFPDGLAVLYIQCVSRDLHAAFFLDVRFHAREFFCISGCEYQIVVRGCQRFGSGKADAARGTCDKCVWIHKKTSLKIMGSVFP